MHRSHALKSSRTTWFGGFYVIYVYEHVIVVAEWFRMWAAYKGGIILYSRSDP